MALSTKSILDETSGCIFDMYRETEKSMIVRKTGMIILALMLSIAGLAQDEGDQWHLENYSSETPGINLEKVYEDFVTGRTPQKKVIVAVIDSGIDIEHEDLKDVIWVNEDEIPGNGIDDDRNGYIDDVNGWNFIGNANGDMVDKDNLEVTRLYAKYHARFGDKKPSASEMDDWKFYQKLKNEFEEKKADAIAGKERYLEIKNFYESSKAAVIEKLGTEDFSLEDIQNIEADTEELQRSQGFLIALDQQGFTEEALVEWGDYVKGQADWYYNPDVDVRATIIKDDINNPYEKGYGNNIVKGPDPSHGTHVAGIIAASRDNGLGGDGIANHVLIMPVRTVPGGDEHDKDVANAILYAVDNGARVINMSFGKSYSPQEKIVAEAIQYAEDKGVLLVHAAGNDSKDVDATNNYPTNFSQYIKGKVKTYLTIGASNHDGGEELPASFTK